MAQPWEKVFKDIKANPKKHHHTFQELINCCTVDGKLWHGLMNAHADYCGIGENNGKKCDVIQGHCSCGAVH